MNMQQTQKPKTNWHLVIWPIMFLWLIELIYVFNSQWKEQAGTVLPIFMVVAAFVVFLLNAFAGSIAQRRYQLQMLDETTTRCLGCGRTDGPMHFVDYHWYLFLLLTLIQFGQRGKFCPMCARARVDGMFRRTMLGSILCPPIIAWAWFQRRKILLRVGQ
jgi:hypothetical protein